MSDIVYPHTPSYGDIVFDDFPVVADEFNATIHWGSEDDLIKTTINFQIRGQEGDFRFQAKTRTGSELSDSKENRKELAEEVIRFLYKKRSYLQGEFYDHLAMATSETTRMHRVAYGDK